MRLDREMMQALGVPTSAADAAVRYARWMREQYPQPEDDHQIVCAIVMACERARRERREEGAFRVSKADRSFFDPEYLLFLDALAAAGFWR